MAKQPLGGHPSKAAVARTKVATVAVSIVAFLSTLGGIAYFNPGVGNTTTAYTQAPSTQIQSGTTSTSSSPSIVTSAASSGSQASSVRPQAAVVPLTRTRGS